MKNKLKVVIDTNILLVSISSKSKYHWIFEKLLNDEFDLFVTNEVLMEYEEIISSKYNSRLAKNVIRTLLLLPNVHQATIYYNWNLIENDADDNKFVDCAVNSNSHVLVTNDKHFDVLKNLDFPKLMVVNISAFEGILKEG
jgi:putative PIN family toxin of toxin-antitoxin system